MRHRVVLGVVLAVIAAGTAVVGAPVATADDTTICVGVVVDPTGSGSTRSPDQTCVTVPQGATGLEVLDARADALNRPRPRVQDGEVCAIDGEPTSGCGESDGNGGYRYWSYWHQAPGASTWSYSNLGADSYSPSNGSLEGWSFQDSGTEKGRQPPPAAFSGVCPDAASSPTPAAASVTSVAPSTTVVAPTVARTTAAAARTGGARTPVSRRPPSSRPSSSPPSSAVMTPSAFRPSVTSTSASHSIAATSSGAPTSPAAPSLVVATRDTVRHRSSSGPPWAAIGAIALALGLGGAATLRSRRR